MNGSRNLGFLPLAMSFSLVACGGSSPAVVSAGDLADQTRNASLNATAEAGYPISGAINVQALMRETSFALAARMLVAELGNSCGEDPARDIQALASSYNLGEHVALFIQTTMPDPAGCIRGLADSTSPSNANNGNQDNTSRRFVSEAGVDCPQCNENSLVYRLVPGGIVVWTFGSDLSPAHQEALQAAVRALGENDLLHLGLARGAIERFYAESANETPPEQIRDLYLQGRALDRILLSWARTSIDLQHVFPPNQSAEPFTNAYRALLQEAIRYVRQGIAEQTGGERALLQTGLDILNGTEIQELNRTSSVHIPFDVTVLSTLGAGLAGILPAILGANHYVETSTPNWSFEAYEQLGLLQAAVNTHSASLASNRRTRRASLPNAALTPPTPPAVNETFDWVSGNANAQPGWNAYGFTIPGVGIHYSLQVEVVGNDVTLHAYGDTDSDGVQSHFWTHGVRNPRTGEIAWEPPQAENDSE